MMRKSKYMTIPELIEQVGRNATVGRKILVLHEGDIDTMLKSGVFRLKGRQVWYGNHTLVFPQTPIELPKDAHIITIPKVELDKK